MGQNGVHVVGPDDHMVAEDALGAPDLAQNASTVNMYANAAHDVRLL